MNYRNLAKRAAALTLAGAMVCGTALATAADGNQAAKKTETVYVTLNSDGSASKTTDSVWLHSDTGLSGYSDETTLSDLSMLKNTEQPQQDGDRLIFSTSDTDAWYQGTAGTDLPVTAAITWTLDGKDVKAEDITGQSGHLVMHVTFTNKTRTLQTIDGESRAVCTPFVTAVAATLDADVFSNVTAENATVQSESSRVLVGGVCMPGLAETYDGLLTGDFSQLNDYLHDDVTIEADVKDFAMPMMYIAAATSARTLGETEEIQNYGDVFDDLDKLDDAMQQLIDGGKALVDGTDKVDDGTNTLLSGISTLDDGAAALAEGASKVDSGASGVQSGAHQVSSGAADAASGAAQLQAGVSQLAGSSQTLRDGAHQIGDSILASANKQMKAAGVITEDMTWSDYVTVLDGVLGVNDTMRSAARESIRSAVAAQTGTTMTDDQLNCLIYLMAASNNSDATAAANAAGAQMQQAQADAAAGGSVYNAKAALTAANGDAAQVPEVHAVLKATAYSTLVSQLEAQGATEEQANWMLVMAAGSGSGVSSASLAAAQSQLTAAAQLQAASVAASNPTSDANVAAVLAAMAAAQQTSDLTAVYQGAVSAVAQATGADANTAAVIFVLAADAAGGDATKLDYAAAAQTAAADNTAAAAVQAAQAAIAQAGSAQAALDPVLEAMTGTAYSTVTGQTGVSDASVNALLVTMAAQAMAKDSTLGLTAALTAAGTTLQKDNAVQEAMTKANDTADTAAQELIKGYLSAQVKTQYQSQLADVAAAETQLQQVNQFMTGVDTYTAGVDTVSANMTALVSGLNTLSGGASALASGTDTLKGGTASLSTGAASLKSGADQLKSGAQTLAEGTSALKGGAQELYDGLVKFNDEGISKLTSSEDLTNLQTILDVTDAEKAAREDYDSYAGIGDNTEGTVSFVMKVNEDEDAASAAKAASAADTTTTEETSGNWFTNLWKRITALF